MLRHTLRSILPAAILISSCATLPACDEKVASDVVKIPLGGKPFYLETAMDNAKRFRGLSERTEINPTGGMLFVFPQEQVRVQNFVMRDCPIPIDIIYLDPNARVVAMYEMTPEPPRGEGEGKAGPTAGDPNQQNIRYDSRLKQYSSRFPSQFVIELKGGTIKTFNPPLKEGDQIVFDHAALAKRAR